MTFQNVIPMDSTVKLQHKWKNHLYMSVHKDRVFHFNACISNAKMISSSRIIHKKVQHADLEILNNVPID